MEAFYWSQNTDLRVANEIVESESPEDLVGQVGGPGLGRDWSIVKMEASDWSENTDLGGVARALDHRVQGHDDLEGG